MPNGTTAQCIICILNSIFKSFSCLIIFFKQRGPYLAFQFGSVYKILERTSTRLYRPAIVLIVGPFPLGALDKYFKK